MKKLFLASSVETTGPAIGKEIGDPTHKRLAFISTAGEVEEDKAWIDTDRKGLQKAGFQIFDYTITSKTVNEIDEDLKTCDIIHVNGGDTFYLLIKARESGFDSWIKEKVEKGEKIYTGSSAGSMVCAPNVMESKYFENDEFGNQLGTFEGFNLVNFLIFPHWGSEGFRAKYLSHRIALAYKPENKIILLNDWQYVAVEGHTYRIIDIRD